jgi:hypothetical protein
MCGTNGDACGACTGTQACSNGACIIPTWCTSQTPPSGVAIADYQCVDFDANTNIPAGWTSSASNGATITVSTEARSSSPNGLKGWVDIDSSGAYITWGNPGTNVSSVAIAADIQPVDNGSFPGEWTGSLDYLCAQVGQVKVCVSYNPNDISPFPSNVMRINYTDGLVSYTCPLFGTLPFLAWTRVTLTVTSSGIATVTSNSMLNGTCQLMQIPIGSTATFRAGVDVTPTIGASSTGYVDNVVAWIKR